MSSRPLGHQLLRFGPRGALVVAPVDLAVRGEEKAGLAWRTLRRIEFRAGGGEGGTLMRRWRNNDAEIVQVYGGLKLVSLNV